MSELWRDPLPGIPSTFGCLVYLASRRNPDTGCYEDSALGGKLDCQEADCVLREAHQRAFAEWLSYSLAQQKADLDAYFSKERAVRTARRLHLAHYLRRLIPSVA